MVLIHDPLTPSGFFLKSIKCMRYELDTFMAAATCRRLY